jgi:tetratricopeptide (TPR) repeat protein
MLLDQGRRGEAIALVEEAVRDKDANAELWSMLGDLRAGEETPGAAATAIEAYAHALDVRPDYAPALLAMADVQRSIGNVGSAQAFIDRYLRIQPDDASALNTKAAIIAQTGMRTEEGLRLIEEALAISERPEFFLTRGLLRMQNEDYREALEDFRRFSATQAQTPADIELQIAEAYAELGENESANLYLRRARTQAESGASVNRERLSELEQRLAAGATP